jgi:hypothetical protein
VMIEIVATLFSEKAAHQAALVRCTSATRVAHLRILMATVSECGSPCSREFSVAQTTASLCRHPPAFCPVRARARRQDANTILTGPEPVITIPPLPLTPSLRRRARRHEEE